MKSSGVRVLLFIGLLSVMAIGGTACTIPPFFFVTSNADAPALTGITALQPEGKGLMQQYHMPGTLNIGALNADGEYRTICVLMNGNRDLEMWDGDSMMYRTIDGNTAWANDAVKQYIIVHPDVVDLDDVDVWWEDTDTGNPILAASLENVLNNGTGARTLWEVGIDAMDGNTYTFRARDGSNTWYMQSNRYGYFRQGDGDTVDPSIEYCNIEDGDVDVATNTNIELTFSDEMGMFQAMLVSQGDSVSSTDDNVYIPLVGLEQTQDGTEYTYTMSRTVSGNLESLTDYYLIILKQANGDGAVPAAYDNFAFAQDLSGNLLSTDNSDSDFDTVDMADVIGGSATNLNVWELKFTTQ